MYLMSAEYYDDLFSRFCQSVFSSISGYFPGVYIHIFLRQNIYRMKKKMSRMSAMSG